MGISKDQRELQKEFCRWLKERVPCQDCGKGYPWAVMDFDHSDREGGGKSPSKSGDVSSIASKGSATALIKEILKCDLVCSNCHRIREFKRDQRV